MTSESKPYTFDRVVRLVISGLVLAGLFFLLRYLSDVLIPFALAVILAYLLNPVVNLFERRAGRGLSVALTLAIVAVAVCTVLAVVVPLGLQQFSRFQRDLVKLRDDFAASLPAAASAATVSGEESVPGGQRGPAGEGVDQTQAKTTLGWKELLTGWHEYRASAGEKPRPERLAELQKAISGTVIGHALEAGIRYTGSAEFSQLVLEMARRVVSGGITVLNFGVEILLAATGIVIVLIYLVFLLLDYPGYARDWEAFLPPGYRDSIVEFTGEFRDVMGKYFRGQAVVAATVGVLFAVGFSIIGLPMAVLFGLFVGLLNMVPYLQTVAIVPGLILAVLRSIEHESSFLVSVLLLLAVFAVVQMLQDAVLTPRILGKTTGLRPVAILLGLFVWGKLLGFLGLLLAIPFTCLFIAYYRRIVLRQSGPLSGGARGSPAHA
ncbi:MAG: AI-2E family transporter [Phycisphaerae bacterium]|nr:AI-2E family transporter [Phycisphaerae bacterium]